MEKTKIAENVKRSERQNRDRERGKNKRDLDPSSSVQRPKKKANSKGPVGVWTPAASIGLQPYGDCGRRQSDECLRRIGACLRCRYLKHHIRDYPHQANQKQALSFVQP